MLCQGCVVLRLVNMSGLNPLGSVRDQAGNHLDCCVKKAEWNTRLSHT